MTFALKLLIVVVLFCALLHAQIPETPGIPQGFQSVRLVLSPSDTLYRLPSEFILSGSESVWLDSTRRLTRERDYTADHRYGFVRITENVLQRIFSDSSAHFIFVIYKSLPLAFKPEYSLRQKVITTDTSTGTSVTTIAPLERPLFDDLFGGGIQKSGSITRGFTIGSNRDVSLSSGFRMQMSGNLSQDVDIIAALTDENTPIQPEGTTQTLQEVDKVFVELKAPRYSATLGDFNFELGGQKGGEFGRLFRKLQGASGTLNLWKDGSSASQVMLTGATQRGKFNTNEFQGIEGNQGPYQLTGKNGERRIVIVAGSDRVFLNGEQMTRGEINDYTIDFSSGEIFFSSKRFITSASRITVDFEYTDRQFTRNLLAGGVETSLLNDRIQLNARYIQEADDPDSPIEGSLDAEGRERLRQSGSDRFQASLPGARFVGRDSLTGFGLGQYVLQDTVIGGRPLAIFAYAPGDSMAVYAVSFSIVEQMPSDSAGYVRVGIGQFRFAGIGKGNYLPIQFLPMPQLQRLLGLNASAEVSSNLSMTGEYAASHLDLNRLSSFDNRDQQGSALKLGLLFNPKDVRIGGVRLGDVDISLSERYVDRRFTSLDRVNEIEFDRKWNLEPGAGGNEEIREASLSVRPNSKTNFSTRYGLLEYQNSYRSRRVQTDITFRDSIDNGIQYQREDIDGSNLILNESSQWTRQRGGVEYALWMFRPGIRIESEERTLSLSSSDSLRQGSFQFLEIAPRIATRNMAGFSASAEFQFRSQDSASTGQLQRAFQSFTQLYQADLLSSQSFSSQLALSIRNTEFTEPFRLRGNANSDAMLLRSQTRYSPYDRAMDATFFYEFANQRSARYERVFLRVPRGTGNYRYKGDLNGNGVSEENEFELTRFDGEYVVFLAPGDQLIPVLDLKTSIRFRLEPQRFFRQPATMLERVLSALSSETFIRVEERSSETDVKQIYLMNLSRFLNQQTTLSGAQYITQDMHIYEHRADFSTRFRFTQRKSLLQLVSATEKSFNTERSVRIRSQMLPEIGNQTEFIQGVDRVNATAQTPRERDVFAVSLNSDFSYRPEPAWEVGLRFEVKRVEDRLRNPVPIVDMNEQSVRTSYSFFGTGQVRAEVKREEVILSQGVQDPARPFPYEFTNGKVIGKSLLWQLAFEYRFNQHMQITLHYNGRREGDRSTVHTGQVEAKVFF